MTIQETIAARAVAHIPAGSIVNLGIGIPTFVADHRWTPSPCKDGAPKIVDAATYPLTAQRPVDVVVTEAATFLVRDGGLVLVEVAGGVSVDWVREHITAPFTVEIEEAARA